MQATVSNRGLLYLCKYSLKKPTIDSSKQVKTKIIANKTCWIMIRLNLFLIKEYLVWISLD